VTARLAVALGLVSTTAAAQMITIAPPTQTVYTGQSATVVTTVARVSPQGSGLQIVAMPAPAGLTLTTVTDMASGQSVNCSSGSGTAGPFMVTCSGNGMTAKAQDNIDSLKLALAYQTTAAGTNPVNLTATCTSGTCVTPVPLSAQITALDYPIKLTNSAQSPTVPAGQVGAFTVLLQNNGSLAASAIDLSEQIPTGATLFAVNWDGTDYTPTATWGGDANGEAQLNGTTLEVRPPGGTLAASGQFGYQVKLKLTSAKVGDTIATTVMTPVTVAPATVAPLSASASFAVGPGGGPSFSLAKSADKQHVRLGDAVAFTIDARPSGGSFSDNSQLVDALDASLSLTDLKVSIGGAPAQAATCDGMAHALGPLSIACPKPGPGGPIAATVTPGQMLAQPIRLTLDCTVRPTALKTIPNTAQLNDAANAPLASAMASVTVDNAGTGGGNLIASLDRSVATRGDLVPVRIAVGAQQPLTGPVLTVDLGRALRAVGTVELDPDGGTPTQVQPTEGPGGLQVPLGDLPQGQVVTAIVRARVGVRATMGAQAIAASLTDNTGKALGGASVTLHVEAEPDFDLATLLGTVFRDENGDGKRQPGEAGIEGVQVVMEDGTTAITDGAGR
jgi:uncharacterized repeat protein (TIGR01451 family)